MFLESYTVAEYRTICLLQRHLQDKNGGRFGKYLYNKKWAFY